MIESKRKIVEKQNSYCLKFECERHVAVSVVKDT